MASLVVKWKTWQTGIARAKRAAVDLAEHTGDPTWITDLDQLPPGCKPYDLRHSFASEMYTQTGDILAVSEMLQHASIQTTKRYTTGAVSARVTAAIAKAAAAFAPVPPTPVPAATPPAAASHPRRRPRGAIRLVEHQ